METGYFDLYEVERGEFRLTGASEKLLEKRQLVPVAEYLKPQARFKLLTDEQIAEIQAQVDAKWNVYWSGHGARGRLSPTQLSEPARSSEPGRWGFVGEGEVPSA